MYTLLILDDEELIRKGIRELVDLKSLSITEVFEAQDGAAGLEVVKNHNIDLVLADINMPKVDGLTFAKRAKEQKSDIKIALITGYDLLDYAVSAVKIGVDDYVLKPVSRVDITDTLRQLIEKKKQNKTSDELMQIVSEFSAEQSDGFGAQKIAISNYLKDNLANSSLSIASVAGVMGFSEGYFGQLFKKMFSVSFREYLLHLRLEKSKVLLLSTDKKNYEISDAVGIQDPNYFSACFKRKYDMTTTEYRSKQRDGA